MLKMIFISIWVIGGLLSFVWIASLLKKASTVNYLKTELYENRKKFWFLAIMWVLLASTSPIFGLVGRFTTLSVPETNNQAPPLKPPQSKIQFNKFSQISSVLSLRTPSSEIDCSQVEKLPDGTWDIFGTIHVGGVTLSSVSGVGPMAFDIGGQDLASLINQACGASTPPAKQP